MNNELIYQSADSPNSVHSIRLQNLQFIAFVEEQANFEKGFFVIVRSRETKKVHLVRIEVDQTKDAEGVCPVTFHMYYGDFDKLAPGGEADIYYDNIISVAMIQVAKRRRHYAYQNMILVQGETVGLFATSLKYLLSEDGS